MTTNVAGSVSAGSGTTGTLDAYPPYRGLRFEEEYALEKMLSGLTVPNAQGAALPVKVFWKDPARELSKLTYPAFMLEFLDMTPRRNEEVRGVVTYGMEPYTANYLPNGTHRTGEFPVPLLLFYQCSVLSRVQQHDVILNDILSTSFFPIRYGQLNCPSGTCRRLDFESMVNRDTIEADTKQRLYCKIWTISISAEWVPAQWNPQPAVVEEVDLTVLESPKDVHEDAFVDANITFPPTQN